METLFGVMVPISMFLGLFTTLIFLRKYENDERMAMIEKGMEPTKRKKGIGFGTLRISLLAIGIGVGIIVALLIMQVVPQPPTTEAMTIIQDGTDEVQIHGGEGLAGAVYSGCILIFGGAGLLLAYLINGKKKEKAEENK
jgi:hypothetical protein